MEKLIFFIIIAVISYIFIRYLINIYNNIVFLKNNCHKAFANIDVLLKKQVELVPILTQVADKAMAHEKQLFSELIASRQRYLSSTAIETKVDIANQFPAKIKPLIAIAENYPTLISKGVLLELQTQVKHVEDQIADRREFFNQTVTLYNTDIHVFPNVIFARLFRFKDIPLLFSKQERLQ
ncbi:LemA family protein [Providencia sp. PROV182]|uniref:LemA family protein n=1 Tax=Providencia sp. PROV182 TaxID=2949885 RepID=UPI00234B0B2F|nr:LemA family protein [Providencia sp. PROV182]